MIYGDTFRFTGDHLWSADDLAADAAVEVLVRDARLARSAHAGQCTAVLVGVGEGRVVGAKGGRQGRRR